ncbi:MAG: PHP domain-containing protein [Nanoarchaeota archaeon]
MAVRKDFQLHSKASDGVWRPSRVVLEAKKCGLETIALTDHNTTFGLNEAFETGKNVGVEVVSGIEISVLDFVEGVAVDDFELLGLYFNQEKMAGFVHELAGYRRTALQKRVDALNAYFNSSHFGLEDSFKKYPLLSPHEVSVDDVIIWKSRRCHYVHSDPIILDFDFVMFLFSTFNPALDVARRYLSGEKGIIDEVRSEYPFLFRIPQERKSFERVISEIHHAGGIAVIAHPGRSRFYDSGLLVKSWNNPDGSQERGISPSLFVSNLQAKGLDGIELYHYHGNCSVTVEEEIRMNEYFNGVADQLSLRITYGSDCHGPRGRLPLIGRFGQP